MFVTFKFRDAAPLCIALALILVLFLLPEYPAVSNDETAQSVFAENERVLIIDAGHGGEDGGAVAADGTVESVINLAIAQKLEALAGLFGIETLMTRTSEDIDYPDSADTVGKMKRADQNARVQLINSVPDGVLISIHQNFYPDPRPSGAQVLYAATDGSKELGEITHEAIVSALCPDNRRVASPVDEDIFLMRSAKCPAILVECGFISNETELSMLLSDTYQTKLAAVLLTSYMQYEAASETMRV